MGIKLNEGIAAQKFEYTIKSGQMLNCTTKVPDDIRGSYTGTDLMDCGYVSFDGNRNTSQALSGYYIEKFYIPNYSLLLYAEIILDGVSYKFRQFNNPNETNKIVSASTGLVTILRIMEELSVGGAVGDDIYLSDNIKLAFAFTEPYGTGTAELIVGYSVNSPYSEASKRDMTIKLYYI